MADLVDAVVAADREIAVASARRAVLVDRARRWSREAAEAVARGLGDERTPFPGHHQADRSLVFEIACALRLPDGAAWTLLAESEALVHEHPATMRALSDGALSYRHAAEVVDATAGLDEQATRELDTILSARAQTTTVAALRRVARRERERHDSRPMVERHRVAATDRTVELQPCRDGMAWLHQLLPAVQATAIFHRLSDIAAAVQSPDDPRTLAQLRADASVDLLLDDDARAALAAATHGPVGQGPSGQAQASASASGEGTPRPATITRTSESAMGNRRTSTAGGKSTSTDTDTDTETSMGTGTSTSTSTSSIDGFGDDGGISTPRTADAPVPSIAGVADRVSLGGIKPQVAVTVPVMTLLGHSEEPGDLAGHGPIDANTARQLAAQAPSFLRILTHPETGTVLSVGRDRYTVPADLKTWLRIRDETCRFPGCSRRAQRCDIDHITDWAHGGTTDHHNLIHLCRHHHRLKHTSRWTVSTLPRGGSAADPPSTQAPSPPDRPSSCRRPPDGVPPRDDSAPTSDVVYWTAPTGREYLDHAALQLSSAAPRDAGSTQATHTGTLGADEDPGGATSSFAEEPPF